MTKGTGSENRQGREGREIRRGGRLRLHRCGAGLRVGPVNRSRAVNLHFHVLPKMSDNWTFRALSPHASTPRILMWARLSFLREQRPERGIMDPMETEIRFDLPTDAPRRVPACPDCGSSTVVPIFYGLPAAETSERARRGEIVLGGCCLQEPRWYCRECLIRRPADPPSPIS